MMRRSLAIALTFGMLAACGPSTGNPGDDDDNGDDDQTQQPDANTSCQGAGCFNECAPGTQTTLSGVVTVPNGIDPVPGALVYVPREVTEFPGEVECEICDQISDLAVVSTTTNFDGSFTLGPIPTVADQPPGRTVLIVSQKGRFRKLSEVPIQNPCENNAAEKSYFQLPSHNDGYDHIPSIAVATGDWDVMECVLLRLGLDEGSFDLYQDMGFPDGTPTKGTFGSLLQDPNKMKSYNIIFINCTDDTYENLLSNATVRNNIEDYVLSGGRLYVTDRSYDYIEQIPDFAPLIDFGPGASGTSPESMNAAYVGDGGIETDAVVNDAGLMQWLGAVEAASGDSIINGDSVHITHFLGGWAMQYAVASADNVKLWLHGVVSGVDAGFNPISGDYPLTTTFDYEQCGRVLYSSYHTTGRDEFSLGGFPDYCGSLTELSPQERVLEYLILHIADCLVVD